MTPYISITLFITYFLASHIFAEFIGKKKQIGYTKSVYWSILFSPIIGLIIILSSPKLEVN
jgi:predicted membrane protein